MALAVIVWLLVEKDADSHSRHPSVTSEESKPSTGTESELGNSSTSEKSSSKKTVRKTQEDSFVSLVSKTEKSQNRSSSYVQAYRKWRYFDNCYTDVEDVKNKVSPFKTMQTRLDSSYQEPQNSATQRQKDSYLEHFEYCKKLMVDDRDFHAVKTRLQAEMLQASVETQEEKDLQHAMDLLNQYGDFYSSLHQARHGWVENEKTRQLEAEIEEMYDNITLIYESTEDISESDKEVISNINAHIEELSQRLYTEKKPDAEFVQTQTRLYEGYINSLHDFLTNNLSSDAFLLLAPYIYQNNIPTLATRQIKENLSIYDTEYIRQLAKVAIPLFACEMGQPCDASSEWVLNHCLGLKDPMMDQACNQRLADFYWNYYLGANLAVDVQKLLNFFRKHYESPLYNSGSQR